MECVGRAPETEFNNFVLVEFPSMEAAACALDVSPTDFRLERLSKRRVPMRRRVEV